MSRKNRYCGFLACNEHVQRLIVLAVVVTACIAPGAELRGAAPEDKDADRNGAKKDVGVQLRSPHYFLGPYDVKKFRKEKAIIEILNEVQWRGNFVMAGQYEGGSVCAISYQLFSTDPSGEGGEVAFAICVDNKFTKFVKWFPFERIQVPYEGTTASRFKPIKIGDISWLIRAVKNKAVDISELEKEVKARPETPSQIDPGLTIAYLLLKFTGRTPAPATEKDYKRNAELRDQFNAARLKIGMSPAEVQAVFKAKPIESEKVAAGDFQVYGSSESFDIDPALLYSNVLVLFKDGKANAIYAIDGGSNWRQEAQERFSDFPGKG